MLAALALAFVVLAGVVAALTREPQPPARPPSNQAGPLVSAPIQLTRTPARPAQLVAHGRHLWGMLFTGGIIRIDARRRQVDYVLQRCCDESPDLAAGFGSLWAATAHPTNGGVERIDPATLDSLARIPFPSARMLAVSKDSVWVVGARSRERPAAVARIEPRRNRIAAQSTALARDPSDFAVGLGAVWISDSATGRVVRVDPRTLRVRGRIDVGPRPGPLALVDDGIWVADLREHTVARIDATAKQPIGAPIRLGKEIEDIAASRNSLWVAGGDGTLSHLDPATGAMRGTPVVVGRVPLRLVPDETGVWVLSGGDRSIRRVEDV
jgi:streptogramin lyase